MGASANTTLTEYNNIVLCLYSVVASNRSALLESALRESVCPRCVPSNIKQLRVRRGSFLPAGTPAVATRAPAPSWTLPDFGRSPGVGVVKKTAEYLSYQCHGSGTTNALFLIGDMRTVSNIEARCITNYSNTTGHHDGEPAGATSAGGWLAYCPLRRSRTMSRKIRFRSYKWNDSGFSNVQRHGLISGLCREYAFAIIVGGGSISGFYWDLCLCCIVLELRLSVMPAGSIR